MAGEGVRVARNTSLLVIVEIIGKIFGIALTLAIARKLGATNFGILAFASSFAFIFGILVHFGFDKLILREVARDTRKTTLFLNNIIVLKLILSIFTFLLIIGTLSILNYSPPKTSIIYVATFIMLTESYILLLNSFYRAHQKVKYEAIVEIFLKILVVSLGLLVLVLGYGLLELLLVQLFVFSLSLALSFYLFNTRISKVIFNELNFDFCKNLIKSATPFLILSISVAIYVKIDIVMLSVMKGDLITGWYAAAYKFLEVFTFIPAAFGGGILPAMSRFSQTSPELLSETYQKATKYLFIIALPIAVGTVILADKIIFTLYGAAYAGSIGALRILIWALVLSFLNYAAVSVFISINKEKTFLAIVIFAALFNISANLVLIPTLSLLGAGIATVMTEGVVYLISLFFISLHLGKSSISQIISKPILSVAIMAFITWLLRGISITLLVPLSAIVYFLTLFLLKTFDEKELVLFGNLFKRGSVEST